MGSRYLADLADVVRAAGLVVHEEPGWQTRARSSGGYNSGLPNHVMIHHTASGPSSDGQPDVNYMCYSADARPVANLYLSRSGEVWIMAAGATNTNGSGGDPCGTIAADSMNSSAVGIEAGHDGTGEPWPDAQQEAYTTLVAALCEHYGIPVGRTHSHAEWAPGRKIDPAGPSRWAGSGTWDENAFRGDVAAGWPGGSEPPTPERKTRMYAIYWDDAGVYWASDMIHARTLRNDEAFNHYRDMLAKFGFSADAPTRISQSAIRDGLIGQPVGPVPWLGGEDQTAWSVWQVPVAADGWPTGQTWVWLVNGSAAAQTQAGTASGG
jgi:hypothetical protein